MENVKNQFLHTAPSIFNPADLSKTLLTNYSGLLVDNLSTTHNEPKFI